MKPIPAIVESDLARHVAAVDKAMSRFDEAKRGEDAAEQRVAAARQVTARARLELGRALIAARACWPARGPKAKGWSDFLRVRVLDPDVALDAMRYAGFVEEFPGTPDDVPGNLPTLREAGIDVRPRAADQDDQADDEPEIDRDTWCTPRWITEAVGSFDLDPCSNERSTVQATYAYLLERGENGLKLLTSKWMDPRSPRVWVNPPYSDVMPWVRAFQHTRFTFLLKLDPSTKWFASLYEHTELILIPRKRVQFVPPPEVPTERAIAQQFPHALFYARAIDATPEIRALCLAWRVERITPA